MSNNTTGFSLTNPGNYCQDGGCDFNIDSIYDKLREDDFQNILIITILLGILSGVGSFGNLCVLLVFSLRFQQRTSTYFILSLAGIDFIICVFVIPGVIVKTWYYKFYFDWLCKLWEMFRMYSLPTSALLLVAIASDRYFLICMATNKIMTKSRSKLIIFTIAILGLGLSIPPLLAVGVYEIDDDGSEMYRGICIENYWLISVWGLHSYWIFVTALFSIMMLLIAVLYVRIFMTVYKQDHRWRGRNRHNKVSPPKQDRGDNPGRTQTTVFRTTELDSVSFPAGRSRLQNNHASVTAVGQVTDKDAQLSSVGTKVTGDRAENIREKTTQNLRKVNSWIIENQSNTNLNDPPGYQASVHTRQNKNNKADDVKRGFTNDNQATVSHSLHPDQDFRAGSSASSQFEDNAQNIMDKPSLSGSLLTMGPSSLAELPPSTSAEDNWNVSCSCLQEGLPNGEACGSLHAKSSPIPGVTLHKSVDCPKCSVPPTPMAKTFILECLQCSKRQSDEDIHVSPTKFKTDQNSYKLSCDQCTCSIQASASTENKLTFPETSSIPCSRLQCYLKSPCLVSTDPDQRCYLPGSAMDDDLTCSYILSECRSKPGPSFSALNYQQAGDTTGYSIHSMEITQRSLLKDSMNEHHTPKDEKVATLTVENLTNLSAGGVESKKSMGRTHITVPNKLHRAQSSCQQNAHIKMARVVFMVTLVYIVSFLPTFLVSYQVIENEAVFYVYFINNAANPVIYSFMNRKFRAEVKGLLKCFLSKLTKCCSLRN